MQLTGLDLRIERRDSFKVDIRARLCGDGKD